MKKIIVSIFIANIALMASDSLCMLTLRKQSPFRQLPKNTPCIQRRGFACQSTEWEQRYAAVRYKNKIYQERLKLLRQDPYDNIRKIWYLEDEIEKNNRRLAIYKLRILEEIPE